MCNSKNKPPVMQRDSRLFVHLTEYVQIPVDWCAHSRISGAPILKYRCADSILNGALSFIMNNETRSLQVEKGAPNAKILNHHWRD